MNLAEFLDPERVLLLTASAKSEALDELVQALARAGLGVSAEELGAAVRKRERLMSTGIGFGIAVPHVRLEGVRRPMMAVGVSRQGLRDYQSLDDEPVRIVVLIAVPAGDHEGYIRLLAETVAVLKQPERRRAILAAESPEQIHRLLTEP